MGLDWKEGSSAAAPGSSAQIAPNPPLASGAWRDLHVGARLRAKPLSAIPICHVLHARPAHGAPQVPIPGGLLAVFPGQAVSPGSHELAERADHNPSESGRAGPPTSARQDA